VSPEKGVKAQMVLMSELMGIRKPLDIKDHALIDVAMAPGKVSKMIRNRK
jgi:hypothetical protein